MQGKKNIGLLEFHCHIKYIYTMAKIVKTENTNVTIFTTPKLFSKVKTYLKNLKDYEVILKEKDEGMNNFFKRVEKICNEKIDLLFINTIQKTMLDFPMFLNFKPKCKMILTIHTANSWFSKKPQINLKKPFRTIDTNVSTIFGKFFILPKFNGINVIYSPIKDFIENKTDYKKPVFTIPFGFYDEINKPQKTKKEDKIIFVIPGQIEEHRRNYDIVIDAFEKIFEKYNDKIEFILLGYPVGAYGKRIINRCKKLKKQGYNIIYYNNFVPEDEYNEIMKNVDFLILPIKMLSTGVGVTPEYYGKTKGSAAVFEGVQYAKPLIVPKNFTIIKELESSTLKYKSSEDLEKTLEEIIIENKDKLDKLSKEACKNSEKFSLPVLQEYFTRKILDKIDSL